MNTSAADKLRKRIKARLVELDQEDALGAKGKATVELDQQSVGRLSRMDALQNQAMAKATDARRNAERQRLNMALERIKEGEYGYCEDCGEDIAAGRLNLDPTAMKCIDCAEA